MAKPPLQRLSSAIIILLVVLRAIPHKGFRVDWTPPQKGKADVIDLSAFEIPTNEAECDDTETEIIVKNYDSLPNPQNSHAKSYHQPSRVGDQDKGDPDKEVILFTNDLLNSIVKRTSYANTMEEIQNLDKGFNSKDQIRLDGESKRLVTKRNGHNEHELHSGGCQARKDWISLGSDHFPRFVKSYNCTSDTCDRNLGECRPKSYTVKVLRMISPNISLVEEGCDPHLPEKLRCDWKLVPILVTTYCECFSGIFGR